MQCTPSWRRVPDSLYNVIRANRVIAGVRYQQESSMTKANFAITVAVTFLYAVVLAVGDRGRGNG